MQITPEQETGSPFRLVSKTGVIFVMEEARKAGYYEGSGDWFNLGQGQPEAGYLPGAPARLSTLEVSVSDQEYAPIGGIPELREAVASFYNQTYRKGMRSQYSAENVCISGGGRVGLARAVACLGHVNLGHFLPDYTAYEELLDLFKAFTSIPILLDPDNGYVLPITDLRREIKGRGLGALLMSNPNNPTGRVVHGSTLAEWVALCKELECALLVDEFYSHYIWTPLVSINLPTESAARYVADVNRDAVLLFDGLTKNWRYPGWRVSWTVGPRKVIESLTSTGSFLDGGGNRPLQRAAIDLLQCEHMARETMAIHRAFSDKRDFMIKTLKSLGIRLDCDPEGTFYCWGDVSGFHPPLNRGMGFFEVALHNHVVVVPGEFFDVNPGKRRGAAHSRFQNYVRFSFGPPAEQVNQGLAALSKCLASARTT